MTPTPGENFEGYAMRAGVLELPEGLIPSPFKGFSAAALDAIGAGGFSAATRFSAGAMGISADALISTGAERGSILGGDSRSKAKASGDSEGRRRAVPGERGGASRAGDVGGVGRETTGRVSWAAEFSTAGAGVSIGFPKMAIPSSGSSE